MKEKLLIVSQPQGIGDIIFSMTLIRNLAKDKYKVLWPVMPHYLDGLQRAYNDITFIPFTMVNVNYNHKEDYENEHYRYVPIRWSDGKDGRPYTDCMKLKYEMYGLDYRAWKDKSKFERNMDYELHLMYDTLKINVGEKYNLVNRYFGSSSQFTITPEINNGLRNIEMSSLGGFSIFDWSSIIENATTIHVANSSILYLLELLKLKAESVNLYCRKPQENNFDNTSYLHSKEYILHY